MVNFDDFLNEIEKEYIKAKDNWQNKTGLKSILPKDLRKNVFNRYIAYRNEVMTKRLVVATWVLAVVTIILSILTLIFN